MISHKYRVSVKMQIVKSSQKSVANIKNIPNQKYSNIDVGMFKTADKIVNKASDGDLIEVQRTGYCHWCLYSGDGKVFHLVQENGSKGRIMRDKLVEYANGSPCRINNKLESAKKRNLKQRELNKVMAEAWSMLDSQVEYSRLSFNCEHQATLWKFGTAFSDQVILY